MRSTNACSSGASVPLPAPVYLTSLVPILNEQVKRDWRHLVFLQFEAWLHADVPAPAVMRQDTPGRVPW